jgi:hypothetical protein
VRINKLGTAMVSRETRKLTQITRLSEGGNGSVFVRPLFNRLAYPFTQEIGKRTVVGELLDVR